jgi:hypothetical protein
MENTMYESHPTVKATKRTLSAAYKSFASNPSATNWCALEAAMYDHQSAHQTARVEASYAKVIAQSKAKEAA